MVIQALGKTTREMRDHYKQGDSFLDFVGPLGLPQHVEKVGHVVVVGGGLGVAPVYPQLRAFKEMGNRTTSIIGFRNKDLRFWEDKFAKYSDKLIVCTDDGSYGRPGFVTEALKDVLANDKPDLVVAIGPLPMMSACTEPTRPFGFKTMGLEPIMEDGTGICARAASRSTARSSSLRRRPEFRRPQVDFKELITARSASEKEPVGRDFAHVCNLKISSEQEQRTTREAQDLARIRPRCRRLPHERARN
jgi:NAD(P)H-flavin reductase